MRSILLGGLVGGLLIAAAPAMAADVGLSINVGQPGFYGEINVGAVPVRPELIYTHPTVIHADPAYRGQPVYLHVRPGYEKHWSKHCGEYNACGRPVYFVRDDWYNHQYVPHYQHHDDHEYHDHDHDRDYHDHDH